MSYPTHGNEYHERQSWKTPCRAATTANITISTALNAGDVLDGVTLAAGDRVLVKNQSTASQNGIYIAGVTPARATDYASSVEIVGGVVVVTEGTVNADQAWICTADATVTVGTTALPFVPFGAVFTPTFFQAKTTTPGSASTTVAFTSFWDEEDNSIGSPQAATGLTYSGGVFTCHARATYAVTLLAELAGGTAGDTYIAFQPSGPDTGVAIKIESGAAADGSGRSQSMTYVVQSGDTFSVAIGGTAGQTPCSVVYLMVTRLS